MNHEEYTAIDALNWSTLKLLDTSPAWLRHCADHPEELGDKPAFVFGRAIHCYILEPEKFEKKYVVVPDFAQLARDRHGTLRTQMARNMRDDLANEFAAKTSPDAERLNPSDMGAIVRGAEAVQRHPEAVALLEECPLREHLVEWTADGGVKCKARLDLLGSRVVDLKSTRRNTLHELLRDAAIFGYHAQCAWYHEGAVKAGLIDGDTLPACIAIYAPTSGTYADVVVLDMETARLTFERGQSQYKRLLERYIGCMASNWWPGVAPQSVAWDLPEWFTNREDYSD